MLFSHAGDNGDLLYALPVMRQLASDGVVDLCLYPAPGMVREPWTQSKVANVRPLLKSQDWIRAIGLGTHAVGFVIDDWRKHPAFVRRNLSDHVADAFDVPHWQRGKPWIEIEEQPQSRTIIVHRSPRYRNTSFPWKHLWKCYRNDMRFIGHKDEWQEFVSTFGDIEYLPTGDLLALAHALKRCRLFIGNQSTPRALAEALAVPVYVEAARHPDNTHFARQNAWYGHMDLPAVHDFLDQ